MSDYYDDEKGKGHFSSNLSASLEYKGERKGKERGLISSLSLTPHMTDEELDKT